MQAFNTTISLQKRLLEERQKGNTIGFVPTMGALHKGHISLVERAKKENSIVVASIFVNPTQFNDKSDYEKYPRDVEKDLLLLKAAGCDLVFIPSEKEMYPEPDKRVFDFGDIGNVMEGKHRPGHFNGVGIIVSKLLDVVKPDRLYLGQKDLQQVAIIKSLIRQLEFPVNVITCPTLREEHGLAMSSRNERLSKEEREKASIIYKTLCYIRDHAQQQTVNELIQWGGNNIENIKGFTVEYLELVDIETLLPVKKINDAKEVFVCTAVRVGQVRLIDNLQVK